MMTNVNAWVGESNFSNQMTLAMQTVILSIQSRWGSAIFDQTTRYNTQRLGTQGLLGNRSPANAENLKRMTGMDIGLARLPVLRLRRFNHYF